MPALDEGTATRTCGSLSYIERSVIRFDWIPFTLVPCLWGANSEPEKVYFQKIQIHQFRAYLMFDIRFRSLSHGFCRVDTG